MNLLITTACPYAQEIGFNMGNGGGCAFLWKAQFSLDQGRVAQQAAVLASILNLSESFRHLRLFVSSYNLQVAVIFFVSLLHCHCLQNVEITHSNLQEKGPRTPKP